MCAYYHSTEGAYMFISIYYAYSCSYYADIVHYLMYSLIHDKSTEQYTYIYQICIYERYEHVDMNIISVLMDAICL